MKYVEYYNYHVKFIKYHSILNNWACDLCHNIILVDTAHYMAYAFKPSKNNPHLYEQIIVNSRFHLECVDVSQARLDFCAGIALGISMMSHEQLHISDRTSFGKIFTANGKQPIMAF